MTRAALLALVLLTPGLARAARGEVREVRVLILDAMGELAPVEMKLLEDTVLNAFRGKDGVLIARNKQLLAEDPLLRDRIDACDEELCLYEAGQAIRAEFVVFARGDPGPEGARLRVGLFEVEAGEIVVDEVTNSPTVAEALPSLEVALNRVLTPILQGTRPNLFEEPTFLTGAGLVFLGSMATLGGLGWAAEMELALADPARHRDEKQFALENGHRALWTAAFGVGITAVGAGVLAWALSE